MSGIQSRSMYDDGATRQALYESTAVFRDYTFFLPSFENDINAKKPIGTCDGKFVHIECKMCDQNKGLITNTRENIDYRLDCEGDLLGLNRISSDWDAQKYIPCDMASVNSSQYGQGTKGFLFGESRQSAGLQPIQNCNVYKPVAQPLLCDRHIVPTNMRQFKSAFEY